MATGASTSSTTRGRSSTPSALPALLTVRPTVDDGRLVLRFPDDSTVEGEVRDSDEAIETSFYGRPVAGRIVEGPLGERAVRARREARAPRANGARGRRLDRGRGAGASLVSTASLDALRAAAGVDERGRRAPLPDDGWHRRRRRRMPRTAGSAPAYASVVRSSSSARTSGAAPSRRATRTPESAIWTRSARIAEYRAHIPTTEPLPFGVWCEVVEPGRVAVGDSVEPD